MAVKDMLINYKSSLYLYRLGELSLDNKELFETINNHLKSDLFDLIKMHYVEERTINDIAQIIGYSDRTVYRKLNRQIEMLDSFINCNYSLMQ